MSSNDIKKLSDILKTIEEQFDDEIQPEEPADNRQEEPPSTEQPSIDTQINNNNIIQSGQSVAELESANDESEPFYIDPKTHEIDGLITLSDLVDLGIFSRDETSGQYKALKNNATLGQLDALLDKKGFTPIDKVLIGYVITGSIFGVNILKDIIVQYYVHPSLATHQISYSLPQSLEIEHFVSDPIKDFIAIILQNVPTTDFSELLSYILYMNFSESHLDLRTILSQHARRDVIELYLEHVPKDIEEFMQYSITPFDNSILHRLNKNDRPYFDFMYSFGKIIYEIYSLSAATFKSAVVKMLLRVNDSDASTLAEYVDIAINDFSTIEIKGTELTLVDLLSEIKEPTVLDYIALTLLVVSGKCCQAITKYDIPDLSYCIAHYKDIKSQLNTFVDSMTKYIKE